jgi:hypothetical protein
MFSVGAGLALPADGTIEGTLDEIRWILTEAGLTVMPRNEGDEKQIVESWI